MPISYDLREFDVLPQIVERVEKLRDDIRARIDETGQRASGATQQNMPIIASSDGVRLVGRAFFASLETGNSEWTGKTGIPCSFAAFKEIIRQWIIDKGLTVDNQERAAGAIAYTIIHRGTKLYREGGRRDVFTPLVEEARADIDKIITLFYQTKIKEIVTKWTRGT